jgi:hypothetical protein
LLGSTWRPTKPTVNLKMKTKAFQPYPKRKLLLKAVFVLFVILANAGLGFLIALIFLQSNSLKPFLDDIASSPIVAKGVVQPLRPYQDVIKNALKESYRIPYNWLAGKRATNECLEISIKDENFEKLKLLKEAAINRTHIDSNLKEEISAKILHNGSWLKAKLRIKGDNIDHLHGKNWSFRIQLKDDESLHGMRTFSLQHPKTRNYIHEWLFHQALLQEDIISLKYDFVRVKLNGDDLGVYAIEEHFEKQLIESNRRRDGPILKFSEELFWENRRDDYTFNVSEIIGFKEKKLLSNSDSRQKYQQAIRLLEAFRQGQKSAGDVFDVERFARYFALTDIFGAHHSLSWINLRFYYNPVVERFEPIGFDGNAGHEINHIICKKPFFEDQPEDLSPIHLLFKDQDFYRLYIKQVERLSGDDFVARLVEKRKDDLKQKLASLYSSYPYLNFSLSVYASNRLKMMESLSMPQDMRAYLSNDLKNRSSIWVCNLQSIPVEVIGLSIGGHQLNITNHVTLIRSGISSPLKYSKIELDQPIPDLPQQVDLKYKLAGSSVTKSQRLGQIDLDFQKSDFFGTAKSCSDLSKFEFLRVDEVLKKIELRSGEWQLRDNLVIPPGYSVVVDAGFRIKLEKKSNIILYSEIHCAGHEQNPIVFEGDGTGGLIMLPPFKSARFENVTFSGLGVSGGTGWSNTGAVTSYEGNVRFFECKFSKSKSEDSLNIIRSKFSIVKSVFEDSKEDAFDCDFSEGVVIGTRFSSSGNDAIDLSGSLVKIQKTEINIFGDKGISAGEGSDVDVSDVTINHGELGIASKDSSRLSGSNVLIQNTKVGCTAYNKKKVYGGSFLEILNLDFVGVANDYKLEDGSVIYINSELKKPNSEALKSKYYGEEFGKKSAR